MLSTLVTNTTTVPSDAPKDTTRENGGPGPRGTEPELLGAGNGRQAPITIKVAFLGSMLGPSALFNTTFCLAALANLRSTVYMNPPYEYIQTLDPM
eukprot:scaffold96388_cov41-Attheya_sp.AAC.1